jgi:2-polyprenyl-3-methyl-5-hydroxy-6-metoxy-1,4-benzoquinol methylase
MATPIAASTAEALAERLQGSTLAALDLLAVRVGEIMGWYAALDGRGPSTAAELAAATESEPRYVREWLEHQAAGGVLEVDDVAAEAEARRYSLPAGHAEALLDRESLAYAAPFARLPVAITRILPDLIHAYRNGGGVPWEAYGADGREAQADLNRPLFTHLLTQEWLPALPDVHERLSQPGARVADVACGGGWASIAIARAYPEARVDGYDLDEASIDLARANAAAAGVGDRVAFHVRDVAAEPAPTARYDLVCVFEAVHDMARPVEALAAARRMLAEGGSVVVADEPVADEFTAPASEMERYAYAWSVVSCLPSAMGDPETAATGAVMRPATLARYARSAGFARTEALPVETEVWRFYRLVP